MSDGAQRHAAATDLDHSLSIEASAGTGKTTLIVERIVNLIGSGRAGILDMAVITFTEKAACELEDRVRRALDDVIVRGTAVGADTSDDRERYRAARADLDRAAIQTIHAFAASLLRRRPVEGAVDPRFRVLDAQEQDALFEETWNRFVAEEAWPGNAPLETLLRAGVKLGALRELAEEFVEHRDLALTAGPTRAEAPDPRARAREIGAWLAGEIPAVEEGCFNHSDRLLERFEQAREIASLAEGSAAEAHRALIETDRWRIAKNLGAESHWRRGSFARAKDLRDEWNDRVLEYSRQFGAHLEGEASSWLATFVGAYEARKKNEGVLDFQDLLIRARNMLAIPSVAADLGRRYPFVLVDELQDTDPLQLEIVASLASRRAEESEDPEERKPPPVLPAHGVAPLLTEPAPEGPPSGSEPRGLRPDRSRSLPPPRDGSVFLVGDPKQSIYSFRRADAALYKKAAEWIDGSTGRPSRLRITNNFRCRPEIAAWVNAVFEPLFGGPDDPAAYAPLVARRAASPCPSVLYVDPQDPGRSRGSVISTASAAPAPGMKPGPTTEPDSWIAADSRTAGDRGRKGKGKIAAIEARQIEAGAIARLIREALRDGAWRVESARGSRDRPARGGDIAVLLRAFGDVVLYEDALRAEGLAPLTSGGLRYFLRPEVAWFGALLRAVECPHDEVAVVAALRSPFFGLSDDEILDARMARARFDPLKLGAADDAASLALRTLGEWHRTRNDAPVGAIVRKILEESGGLLLAALRPYGEQTSLNLLKVADLARTHESDGGAFRSFVRWLGRASRVELEEGDSPVLDGEEDSIRIMTIHAAKGLEFPIVVVGDLARRPPAPDTFLVDRDRSIVRFALKGIASRSKDYEDLRSREKILQREERRRLLYVAATRARDCLILPIPFETPEESFAADLVEGGALPVSGTTAHADAFQTEGARLPNGSFVHVAHVPPRRPDADTRAPAVVSIPPAASAVPDDSSHGEAAEPSVSAGRGGSKSDSRGSEARGECDMPSEDPLPESALEVWERERAALLDRASQGPVFLAASRAPESAQEDDLAIAGSHRAAILSDLGPREERVVEIRERAARRARVFGLAVHGVLEDVELDDISAVSSLAAARADQLGCGERARDVAEAARRALALPAVREAMSCRMMREVPVTFFEGRTLVEGQIDLVFEREDGSLVVADYKTDDVTRAEADERAGRYRSQLALYAMALERATGRPVRDMVLLFIVPGVEIRWIHDEESRSVAMAAIAGASKTATRLGI